MALDPLRLLQDLVRFPSLSPRDAGCQDYLATVLTSLGFQCTQLDHGPVSNLYAQWGTKAPLLLFAGHTDVVPPGDEGAWHTPPFELTEKNNCLYGRGVADMKGALVAMLLACETLVPLERSGSLGFLITSGEEGDDFLHGTPHVMAHLKQQGISPHYCIVGEPSSQKRLGDTLKIGRRGSFTATLTITGKQGHVAYPRLADNPIHKAGLLIQSLNDLVLDQGSAYFPPSSLQIVSIQSGGTANNVIPGTLSLTLNIRFSTEQTEQSLKQHLQHCLTQCHLPPDFQWQLNGAPFLTAQGKLLEVCTQVLQQHLGHAPHLSTDGGTSDGRFIAPYGIEVLELGLLYGTIHQANECIGLHDLQELAGLYQKIIMALLA